MFLSNSANNVSKVARCCFNVVDTDHITALNGFNLRTLMWVCGKIILSSVPCL